MSKVVSAEQAVALIPDGGTLGVSGFRWAGSAELVLRTMAERFDQAGAPRNLTLVFSSASGDNVSNGLEHLARPGLVKRVIGGFFGATPALAKLVLDGKIEGYNFPQGQIARLYGAIASGQPGLLSRIGLDTYIDPRRGGGKLNAISTETFHEIVRIRGQEWLLYHAFPIHTAIIRGTTADTNGNLSLEHEAVTTESLPLAFAAHNSGGKVIAQVKRVVEVGKIPPRSVTIPGHVVDAVVVAKDIEKEHRQCVGSVYDPTLTGEAAVDPAAAEAVVNIPLVRRIVALRAMRELRAGDVVNLGQGIPSEISALVRDTPLASSIRFTIESGVSGGLPQPVPDFGVAKQPESILRQDDQFMFYDGGGLDVAFLGFAEIDRLGDLNVSKFGSRVVGCGGFLDIAQPAKRLVFCGAFRAGKTEIEVSGGKMRITQEGGASKFVKSIQQLTFNASRGREGHQRIVVVTERCVFDVVPEGLRLVEVAPGLDLQRDILQHMEYQPIIADPLRPMPLNP